MERPNGYSLALLVKSAPYARRVARADIDLALAAAALDLEVHVYFSGRSILQLASRRNPGQAMLPAGYKAWSALPDLAEVHFYAERHWLDWCADQGLQLMLTVAGLSAAQMQKNWRGCNHVMVI